MAGMTGALQADFASFDAACRNSVVELRSFETGGAKVETALNKMVDSFSGRKIIQDATLMEQAFQALASKGIGLTDKELQRMGATAQEAIGKMKAMGVEVPPGLLKIASAVKDADKAHSALMDTVGEAGGRMRALGTDVPPGLQKIGEETKKVDTVSSGLMSTVKSVALGFAAMFTARAAYDFVKDTIDEASALKNLSQQTRVGVEDLQLLGGAMSEFGVDADELGKALFGLSKGIAGGDESVARGLHTMGMGLKEVDGLNGKELFLKIMGGLSTLQGGLRDSAAADLFGSKLGAAMAGASEGIEGTLDTWQKLNRVASTESVNAMDAFGSSIARANTNLSSIAANMIGPVAQGFNVVHDAAMKTGTWTVLWAMLKDGGSAMSGFGSGTEYLTRLLDQANVAEAALTATTATGTAGVRARTVALTADQQAVKFLASLQADAGAALDASQLRHLAQLKAVGALNAANAGAIGVNAAQYAKYTADQTASEAAKAKAIAETEKALVKETKALADQANSIQAVSKLWRDLDAEKLSQSGTTTQKLEADIRNWAATARAGLDETNRNFFQAYAAIGAIADEKLKGVKINHDTLRDGSKAALQDTADRAQATYAAMLADSGKFTAGGIANAKRLAAESAAALDPMKAQWEAYNAETQRMAEEGIGSVVTAFGQAAAAADQGKPAVDAYAFSFQGLDTSAGRAAMALLSVAERILAVQAGIDAMDSAYQRAGFIQQNVGINTAAYNASAGAGLPSFARGGSGDFGAGTPVMLHGKEAIIPLSSGGGVGGQTINIAAGAVQIVVGASGSGRQAGREAADALLARLQERGVRV